MFVNKLRREVFTLAPSSTCFCSTKEAFLHRHHRPSLGRPVCAEGLWCWTGPTPSSPGSGRQEPAALARRSIVLSLSLCFPIWHACHLHYAYLEPCTRKPRPLPPSLPLSLCLSLLSPLSLIFFDSCWYFLLFGFQCFLCFRCAVRCAHLCRMRRCDWSRKRGFLWSLGVHVTSSVQCHLSTGRLFLFIDSKLKLCKETESYLYQWLHLSFYACNRNKNAAQSDLTQSSDLISDKLHQKAKKKDRIIEFITI